jgi:hypothetical protein
MCAYIQKPVLPNSILSTPGNARALGGVHFWCGPVKSVQARREMGLTLVIAHHGAV